MTAVPPSLLHGARTIRQAQGCPGTSFSSEQNPLAGSIVMLGRCSLKRGLPGVSCVLLGSREIALIRLIRTSNRIWRDEAASDSIRF